MIVFVLMMVFGLGLIALPIAGSAAVGLQIGAMASVGMISTGIGLVIISSILLIVTELYVKSRADEALVRTGNGGAKVVLDGGILVIPVIHELIRVPLAEMKIEVNRTGGERALITGDNLRADIQAEFYVKVDPSKEAVKAAAQALGVRLADPGAIKAIIEEKLVSALRNVAAKKTLFELHTDRDEFVGEVQKILLADLQHNGLVLTVVTISQLDQTSSHDLDPANVFNAKGLRAAAEITQAQATERNRLEREGELARKAKDVETRQEVLKREQEQAVAEAEQAAQISQAKAEQDRLAQEKQIAAERAVKEAQIARDRALEVAAREQQAAVGVAEQEKAAKIADAEALKAAREAEAAKAKALEEKERQNVETVRVEATAERAKRQEVINAQAKAEAEYARLQRAADAKAYEVEKEAEAGQKAAEAKAEAIRKAALADRDAEVARAEGQKAAAMVPVEVKAREVEVERDRVETVLKSELEARERSGKVAQDFELEKLRIEQAAVVQIETARATATWVGKIEGQFFGTPEDLGRMLTQYRTGMGLSEVFNGALAALDPKTAGVVSEIAGRAMDVVSSLTAPKAEAAPTAAPEVIAAAPVRATQEVIQTTIAPPNALKPVPKPKGSDK
jgi:uncharacterized membrane protein YqiK